MNLDELRTELGAVDQQLLELVARRQELASQIGRVKRQAGQATRDYGQEKRVIDRARARASALGFAPDLAEKLMLALIESSLTQQEREGVAARGRGSGKSALVIGGRGQIGGWFVRFLGSQGYAVDVADPAGPVDGCEYRSEWSDGPLDHDLIVVAAPLGASNDVLHGLAAARPPGVVFDVGSLKSPLRTGLRALVDAGVRVTSLHPMFGPNTELLSKRHVVFVDLGHEEANRVARELFDETMAVLVSVDLESHDRVIAYVLGLSHAINIAFATALAESGESVPRLAEVSSTTFASQLAVARAVSGDNPHLYYEIQALNDYGTESLSALLVAVEKIRSVVRAGDETGFVKLMEGGRAHLDKSPA